MKKLLALLLAAVLTAAFAGCGQTGNGETTGADAAAISAAFDDCQTAEDYLNAAKQAIESNDIYTANEAIKAGYRATKDSSLRLAVVNGKPTVEAAVILHRIGVSTVSIPSASSMQYFLGRDVVLGRVVTYDKTFPAFIYSFHPQTHKLQAIEVCSLVSYDKLDTDLLNIALSSTADAGFLTVTFPVMINVDQAAEASHRRETAPLNVTYRFEYDADGALCGLRCGAVEADITKTATGYQLTMPNDPIGSYGGSPGKLEMTFDLQDNKIVKLTDSQADKTETFSYGDDGSYTAAVSKKYEYGSDKEDNATVNFNNNHLPEQAVIDGTTYSYTYNSSQTLIRIEKTGEDEKTRSFSYDDSGRLQSVSEGDSAGVFLYDGEGRLAKYSEGANSLLISYDDKGRCTEYGERLSLNYSDSDGSLTSFCLLDSDGNVEKYGDSEKRYNIVRDDDGFAIGLSNPGAEIVKASDLPLYPGFGNLDEQQIYINDQSDNELWLQVRGITCETYDAYKASAIEAGCTKVQLNDYHDDDENAEITRLIDTVDSPARTIELEYWDSASILNVRVHLGTEKWFEY